MKRPIIILTVTDVATGQEVHREQRGAHNAGFHASESAVRAIARAEGQMYTGGTPEHIGGRFAVRVPARCAPGAATVPGACSWPPSCRRPDRRAVEATQRRGTTVGPSTPQGTDL